jgi:hypothetical protein
LRFQLLHALSTCGNRRAASALGLALILSMQSFGRSCDSTHEIISNNMKLLAGAGDTLCVASLSQQGWGVNYTLNQGQSWWGYYLGCYTSDVWSMAFGNATLALILKPPAAPGHEGICTIWHCTLPGNKIGVTGIKWPDSVLTDTSITSQANNVVYAEGKFYFACQNGGLVRWNPQGGALRGFWPGSAVSFDPATVSLHGNSSFTTKRANVIVADVYKSPSGTKIIALTAPQLWLFNLADTSWDSSVTTTLADANLKFGHFSGVFVNNTVSPPLLYAYIDKKEPGADSLTLSLFRYHWAEKKWARALKNAPNAVAAAPRGFLYGVNGPNQLTAYHDSLGDSAVPPSGGLAVAVDDQHMTARVIANKGIDLPDNINDLLFIPYNDSMGHFWIASSNGLFLSNHERPGDSSEFILLHRDRAIQAGLKETYALPGIINNYVDPNTGTTPYSKCKFVYKLGSDANVTIRVYDFSMRLVTTIIENEPRKAATAVGRSTNEKKDIWEGTTGTGRSVAPGVYYYKITASTGERSFGKIVVAKGSSN